jgi:hypothetical protein
MQVLSAELVLEMARLARLEISLERAQNLIPALQPVFDGDAEIIKLKLGTLSTVGDPWLEVEHG